MTELIKTYLGDGLYAQDEGFQFMLYTDRMDGKHFVALDDSTLKNFFGFIERTRSLKITIERKKSDEVSGM